MDDFITLARTLISVGLALLLVMLRLDAERFGTAEYYEATRDGERPRIRRRLGWYGLGFALAVGILLGLVELVLLGPVAGLGGAGVDAGHTHDPGPRAGAASAGTTPGPPGTQQDPLARELSLGQRVDPGVDRLVRHRVGHPLSVLTAVFVAQPARDLIRGVPRP